MFFRHNVCENLDKIHMGFVTIFVKVPMTFLQSSKKCLKIWLKSLDLYKILSNFFLKVYAAEKKAYRVQLHAIDDPILARNLHQERAIYSNGDIRL